MTGNLVLFGIGIGRRQGSLVAHAGIAVAAYGMGVLAASRVCPDDAGAARAWAQRARWALGAELALLAGVAVAWLASSGRPSSAAGLVTLAMAALAMGAQSAVVRAAPARLPSTTYLTGALTDLVAALGRGRGLGTHRPAAVSLTSVVAGAGLTALLVAELRPGAPFVALVAVAGALAMVATGIRDA